VETAPTVAFWGPPGTGKTTTLLDVLEREIEEEGVAPSRIGGFTYRKAMAEEFRDRATETAGFEGEGWFKTTHAACFALLDMSKEQTCDADARREFCEAHGYGAAPPTASGDQDALWTVSSEGQSDEAAAMFKARAWCINLGLPLSKWRVAPLSDEELDVLSDARLADFVREYDAWKDANGLLDFEDMLTRVLEERLAPPVDVLIEDEFQDKTPLQVALYNVWAERADRVYVAGDPWQAIYTYQGTDPAYMERAFDMAEDARVLGTSYRLGAPTVAFAKRILRRGGHELPEIEPRGETDVRRISWDEYGARAAAHGMDETFHLVRANYMKDYVAGVLSEEGVPFEDTRSMGSTWTPRQRHLYNGVCRARRVLDDAPALTQPDFDSIPTAEAAEFARALPGSVFYDAKGTAVEEVSDGASLNSRVRVGDVGRCLSSNPFRGLGKRSDGSLVPSSVGSDGVRKRLARAFESRGGEPIEAVSHALSTIHAAKGQERPVVFLLDASTYAIQSEGRVEDESLVWYVGATRSGGILYVVEDFPGSHYTSEVLA
jgi:superfamily I DNA/RNA helicase